jgi:hypothetical protein
MKVLKGMALGLLIGLVAGVWFMPQIRQVGAQAGQYIQQARERLSGEEAAPESDPPHEQAAEDVRRLGSGTCEDDPRDRVIYEYDVGCPPKLIEPEGRRTRFYYFPEDDPCPHVIREYDELGQLVTLTKPSGHRTRFQYDAQGNRLWPEADGKTSPPRGKDEN